MSVTVSPAENAAVGGPVIVLLFLALSNLLAWLLNERSWGYRHILSKAPKLLFVSNRADGVPKAARPTTYWTFDLLDPQHLVRSPLLNTTGLLVLHAATFLYFVATVLVDVVIEWYGYGCTASWCWRRSGTYLEWMTFLTNWSISILGIAGLVAFINTARHARQQQRQRHAHKQQQQQHIVRGTTAPSAATHAPSAVAPAAAAVPAAAAQGVRVSAAGLPDAVVPQPTTRDQLSSPSTATAAVQPRKQPSFVGVPTGSATTTPVGQQQQQQEGVVSSSEPPHYAATTNSTSSSRSGRSTSSSSGGSCCSSCDTVVVVGPADDNTKPHAAKWDWLSKTHCILMEVATAAAFFVSFWFWVGLVGVSGMPFRANGGTLMAHAGNLCIALLQLLLTRLPIVSTHFQVLLWYASLYEIFLIAFGQGKGTWRYGLDWQKWKPAGALVLVPLVAFIFFCLWFLLARGRESLFTRRQRHVAARHNRHNNAAGDKASPTQQHTGGDDDATAVAAAARQPAAATSGAAAV